MVQAFDHRAASVVINPKNVHRPAQERPATEKEHADPEWSPTPQYYVRADAVTDYAGLKWQLGFKEITSPTNERTFISAVLPNVGFGNKVPILVPLVSPRADCYLLANFNALPFDFCARQKIHGQTLNWFLVEQLPVVPPDRYARPFGAKSAADIVRDHVLRLSYTAHDLEPFARDLGYDGAPFVWDQTERMHLRARLDALYFHLYGVTDEADVRHILSTFPIVARKDREAHDGVYLTEALILWYMRALAADDCESTAPLEQIKRQARAA